MLRSLVVRTTLLMATILALSFALWVVIVHRSTTSAFVESQREILTGGGESPREGQLRAALEEAFARGGRDALESVDLGLDYVIVDGSGRITGASEPAWLRAEVTEDPPGTLHLHLLRSEDGDTSELALSRSAAPTLRSAAGEAWGRLVVIPGDPGRDVGERFAVSVWRSAALWLVAVVLIAVATTALVLRRSLSPIDRLTGAARELQHGRIPERVRGVRETEFRELVDAFNAALDAIERTESLRRDLVADIAHELRTPVTNIKAQLEACEAGLIAPGPKLLETLRAESRLLERLVEDFQQLALADAGQLRLHLADLPLGETLELLLRPLVGAADAELDLDVPEGLAVIADEERLRQVLANLVDNAARHRPRGLRLSVSASPSANEHKQVTLRFADNGPGIAPADRPHVFERFYRAEKSRNRASGGSGLGLSIVQGLVEALSGSIHYEEAQGGGACFVITLPRSAS